MHRTDRIINHETISCCVGEIRRGEPPNTKNTGFGKLQVFGQLSEQNGGTVGLFPMLDILQCKSLFTKIPECILEYNEKNCIIMKIPTNEAVSNRQKRKILKKIANISEISSKIISALNKVTDETLDMCANEIIKIENISTSEGINELANILIKKVSSDKHFVSTYANLCVKLNSIQTEDDVDAEKRTLITSISTKCKEIFDKYCDFKGLMADDKNETFQKIKEQYINDYSLIIDIDQKLDKTKVINHTVFVGNLYNMNILKQSAIDYCIDKLIIGIKTINFSVEMVTLLIKTVFQKYNTENSKKLKKYYGELVKIIPECTAFRDKFMIQNLIDKNPL